MLCKKLLNVTGSITKKQYYYYTKVWNLRVLMIKYFELKQQMCHLHLTTLLLICSAATRTHLTMNWMGNLSINFAHLAELKFSSTYQSPVLNKRKRTSTRDQSLSSASPIITMSSQHRRRNPSKESNLSQQALPHTVHSTPREPSNTTALARTHSHITSASSHQPGTAVATA